MSISVICCGECRYWGDRELCPILSHLVKIGRYTDGTGPEDFCSWGEIKEDEDE